MGLVNAVTEPEKLDVAVQDLATKLAQSPPKAVPFSKSYWKDPFPTLPESVPFICTVDHNVGEEQCQPASSRHLITS